VSPARPAAVVVLAAGEGTRMKSSIPKVLHAIGGRSLVGHAVKAAEALDPEHLVVVVGHGRDQVTAHLAETAPRARTAVQEDQRGTGHAVQCALRELPELTGTVVVTYGDVPLLTGETLHTLVASHEKHGNGVTVLTARVPAPAGYGRVLRDADGTVTAIVEDKDATPLQREVDEINSGIYAFDAAVLRAGLDRLTTDNSQGELYLTDVLGLTRETGRRVGAVSTQDAVQTEGVNDRVQLARLHGELNRRTVEAWMRAGVTMLDPDTTWVDVDVTIEADVTIEPNVLLRGSTRIEREALVGPNCLLVDTVVGANATVADTTSHGARIGPEATVGPYTYLRPGTVLGRAAKAGGFVEMKAAVVGDGSKVPHLSYVGDADIGVGVNIGAATVFVNYDGVDKHRTVIGDHARVGSDTMLVAPVHIGDGAYTAAGSVITSDVPAGAMAVARGKQRNVEGWVERRRAGSPAAQASARARGAGNEKAEQEQSFDDQEGPSS